MSAGGPGGLEFLTEPAPPHDRADTMAPGVRRLVAPNPGPMTLHGTNTYLLDWENGVAVVDPGPEDAAHAARILALAGAPVRAILLTHGHRDHWGGLAALRAATGAPLFAHAASVDAPEVPLPDGGGAGSWRAMHTPGHADDHVCFYGPDGLVLSGDHVMGWSTTVVAEAGGGMAAYMDSLRRMLARPAALFLPGHGPAITSPFDHVRALLRHREAREAQVLAALGDPATAEALVHRVYPGLDEALVPAAGRSVGAHLDKLRGEGRATEAGGLWSAA